MQYAIDETNRRRALQMAHNEKHGITPKSVEKPLRHIVPSQEKKTPQVDLNLVLDEAELGQRLDVLRQEMLAAAQDLQYERAAQLRDEILRLEEQHLMREAYVG